MTSPDASLLSLTLQLGRCAAATMDVDAALGLVCSTVPALLGIGGAVIVLADAPAGVRPLTASDDRSEWLGELQHRAEMGPLPAALRTGRRMFTADMTRIGPPALAAAAAECGLVSSIVIPIAFDELRLGALQLLSGTWRPLESTDCDALQPLLDVMAARLVDVRALSRTAAAREKVPDSPSVPPMPSQRGPHDSRDRTHAAEATTPSLPVVTARTAQVTPTPSSSTTPRSFAPQPASPHIPPSS